MKELLLLSLLVLGQFTFSQEEFNLNNYKYIVIENLYENAPGETREGFARDIEDKLLARKNGKIKYFVIGLNSTKPPDLIDNPNLGLYVNGFYSDTIIDDIKLKSKVKDLTVMQLALFLYGTGQEEVGKFSYRRAYFEFYDYRGNLLKTSEGCQCILQASVYSALKFMIEFDYKYKPN